MKGGSEMSSKVTTLRRRPQSRGYLTVGSTALAPETSAYAERSRGAAPRLRVAPPPPVAVPRAPFVALVLLVVIGGVLGILLLNTKINDLRQKQAELNHQQQLLEEEIAVAASSVQLIAAANRLGLVRDGQPPHLWVPSGRLDGTLSPTTGEPSRTSQEG